MPDVEMLSLLSKEFGVSINELISGERLWAEDFKKAADDNLVTALNNSTFTLKEKIVFFKKKWLHEHISTIVLCVVAWIGIIIWTALKLRGSDSYALLGAIGSMLAIWVNKLRCSCGSSYRKNKWHTKLDGKTSYGYQCYNQLNNGIRRKRAEIGLDTEGYCDSRMITDWKLDFMAKALLEHLWQERKESVLIALDLIRHYYKEERTLDNKSDAASIQARIDKANSRLANLIAMRADGEISKDEYQSMRSPIDKEIKELQKALEDTPTNKCCPRGLDLEGIRSTLNSLIDFSGSTISHDVINQFVYMVTPTSDTTFDWYVNLNGTADVKATFTAEGRKKSCIIKLEEIEKISSLHRKENEDNAHLIKNPIVFAFLHRLPLRTSSK